MSKERKPGVNFHDITETLDRVCSDRFLIKDQAAFRQVRGPNGHRMYIAIQENVRRIDLAFTPDNMDGVIKARKPGGSVEWEIDCASPAALATIERILGWMVDAPPVETKRKQAFVPSIPALAQRKVRDGGKVPESPDDRAARAERIRRFARERGVEVSPNADID